MGKGTGLIKRCSRRGSQERSREREIESRGKAEFRRRGEPVGESVRQKVVSEKVFMGVLGVMNEGTMADGRGRAESSARLGAIGWRRDGN